MKKKINKYMTIWEKVCNKIKKIIVSLYIIKKYLKAEKGFNTKESFQCFYIPVILFDSVYRKDGSYYLKVYLEKFIHNIFCRSISFGSGGFESSS